jgi:hypothetical protein
LHVDFQADDDGVRVGHDEGDRDQGSEVRDQTREVDAPRSGSLRS